MRELKFRQAMFDKDGKFLKYHYWGLIGEAFFSPSTGLSPPKEAVENSYQYTGLHDKNMKEIFEGDILTSAEQINSEDEIATSVVQWSNTPYKAHFDFGVAPACHLSVVIGNIHENPELLK